MEQVVVTGILVKKTDGKILLVKKPDDIGPYAGMFLTPGGGLEKNESIDVAVCRELYEETGVTIFNLQRVYFDDAFTENWKGIKKYFIMLLYTADYKEGDLKPTTGDDDHLEIIQWFSPEEISHLKLSPPLAKLLKITGYLNQ